MKRTIIMLAAVLLLTGGAKTVWGYTVNGVGGVSCGRFLSEDKSRRGKDVGYIHYIGWMNGYITRRNYERAPRPTVPERKRRLF